MRIDDDAVVLDPNDTRVAIFGEEDFKMLEKKYFAGLYIPDEPGGRLFGGTLGKNNGGVTAVATAANGKLVA